MDNNGKRPRALRKIPGTREIDNEIRGGANIIKTLQFFSILGTLGQEHTLHRVTLSFLLGVYIRQEQRTKHGRIAPGLKAYVKDYKGGYSKALIRSGYIAKEPSGELVILPPGLEIVRKFISLCKYAHQNYNNSLDPPTPRAKG